MRAGLLQPPTGATPAAPAPAPDTVQNMGSEGFDEGAASEQEQEQYNELMDAAFGLIHTGEYRQKTLDRLKAGAKDMGRTIGEMALAIFTALEGQVLSAGGEVSDAVRLEVGEDIITELLQVAVAAGLMPEDDKTLDDTLAKAMQIAMGGYAEQARGQGRVQPDQIAGTAQKLNKLTQAVRQQTPR